ncbi:MAG: phosphatase PAP2 family protein [Candidatus Marinimicrobia bacterium]|nr:phosphatase PAP2 family protein [Candidatus Neomarinimicrobiota bacterium]
MKKFISNLLICLLCFHVISLKGEVSNKEYLFEVIPGAAEPSFVFPVLAGGAILSLAMNPLEKSLRDHLYTEPFLPESVSHFCDRYITDFWFLPVSAAGALAEGMKHDHYYKPLRHMVAAHAINLGFTYALKWSIGRIRPDGTPLSFPSGHSSIAFTTATLMYNWHGTTVGAPMYAFAALTALSRVNDKRHWPVDVLFGAVLGTVTARALYLSEEEKNDKADVVPLMLPIVEFRFSTARWSRK